MTHLMAPDERRRRLASGADLHASERYDGAQPCSYLNITRLSSLHVDASDAAADAGCMTDVRFAGEWLPMDVSQNVDSRAADYLTRSQHVQRGCASQACGPLAGTTCHHGMTCVDLWRYAECR